MYLSYHLKHRCSTAGANVDGPTLFSAVEILQSTNVRRSQIRDVNVVPDCSAVGRRVVGPKDLQALALSQSSADGQRNQVSLVLMLLAQFALRIGAGGVEITESHPTNLASLTHPLEDSLDDQL